MNFVRRSSMPSRVNGVMHTRVTGCLIERHLYAKAFGGWFTVHSTVDKWMSVPAEVAKFPADLPSNSLGTRGECG